MTLGPANCAVSCGEYAPSPDTVRSACVQSFGGCRRRRATSPGSVSSRSALLREMFAKIVVERPPSEHDGDLAQAREAAATAYTGRATYGPRAGEQAPVARRDRPAVGRSTAMRPQGPNRD